LGADGLTGSQAIGDVNNVVRAGATVKIYRDGGDGLASGTDDVLIGSTTTNGSGLYSFLGQNGTYWVVVDSKTVTSSLAFNAGYTQADVWAEQTYESVGAVGSLGFQSVSSVHYGGRNLESSDDSTTLSTSEHVTRVIVNSANQTGINSGFSFSAVTRTGDGDDDVSNNRTVQGSLRQFIQNSNALAGIQTSDFRLQTSDSNWQKNENGQWLIRPTSALPTITDAVILDGTTQSTYVGTPVIEIAGDQAGASVNGLHIIAGNSTVRGFSITDFSGDGIKLETAGNNTVEGNIIGLRTVGNGTSSNVIGGTTAWYTGDGNVLDSVGNHHGTLTNGATFADGVLGKAISLDGVNDYVILDTADKLGLNGEFTVSAWIKPNAVTGDYGILAMDTGSGSTLLHLNIRNSKLYMGFFGNDTAGNQTLTAGTWYHVTFRYSGGVQETYINGVLDAQSSGHAPMTGTSMVNIGRYGNSNYYNGLIDNLAIQNRAISTTEITALYNAGIAGKTPAMTSQVAYLQSENNTQDTRNINAFTTSGNTTYTAGKVGTAFLFDGAGDAVTATTPTKLDSAQISYATWFKLADTTNYPTLLGRQFSNNLGYMLHLGPDGSLRVRVDTDLAVNQISQVSTGLDDNNWHLAVLTLNQSTNQIQLSVDGSTLSTSSFTGTFSNGTAGNMQLGAGIIGGYDYQGALDETQIFNRQLTNAEVAQLYASGLRGSDVGNNTGIEISNSSGNDIGGLTTAERNIISGNTTNNVLINGNGIPSGTISWWKADGNANDTLGSNNGTLTNGATIVSNGKSGSAFSFDGINDYVNIPNESNFDFANQQFTVDGWFKTSVTGTDQHLIAKGSSGQWQWGLRIEGDNKLAAIFWDSSGSNVVSARSNNALTDGQWHYFAAVFDTRTTSEDIQFFVDGALQTSVTNSGASRDYGTGNANVYIGGRGDGAHFFNGQMDDIAIVGRAMSQDEIQAIYRSGGGSKNSNFVQGNYIGTDITGTKDAGTTSFGVRISGSSGNLIGGTISSAANVISGNDVYGIRIDSTSYGNLISGNYIGTNATGTAAVSNGYGVMFEGGARNTIGVGLDGVGLKNVISGNISSGVHIYNLPAYDNVVAGNYIGTNAAGTSAIGNNVGVYLQNTGSNLIGGDTAGEANLISGNGASGIFITGNGAETGMVGWWKGDNSSTDVFGVHNATLFNGATYAAGVTGTANTAFSFNGSTQYASIADSPSLQLANALSLSAWINVNTLTGGTGYQTVVSKWDGSTRNYGLFVKSNGSIELQYYNAASQQIILTSAAGLVSTGSFYHIAATMDTATNTMTIFLNGTVVGTQSMNGAIKTNSAAVTLGQDGGTHNFNGRIDELAIFERALSSSEVTAIYRANGSGFAGNTISGNLIGTNAAGTSAIANNLGVHIESSKINTVGGSSAGTRNVISGNSNNGVYLSGVGTEWNTIAGNYIGTNSAGTSTLANLNGVVISNNANNIVGGTTVGFGNLISGNTNFGIQVSGENTYGTSIVGNYIGTDASGNAAVANTTGILLQNAGSVTLGGSVAGSGNLISGNTGDGVYITGNGAETGLIGWWKANNTIDDVLGKNPATLVNGATYGTGVNGAANTAFSFNGSNQYATVADSDMLDLSSSLSVDAWINATSLSHVSSYNTIIAKAGGGTDRNFYLGVMNDGTIHVHYNNPAGGSGGFNSAAGLITTGTWYHVALTIDVNASTIKLYVNGVQVASGTTNGFMASNSAPVSIGAYNGASSTFNGRIDEVGMYSRVLTSSEVADIYHANGLGKAGNTIIGNLIGTNSAGTTALGNGGNGVIIDNSAINTIGGSTTTERNVIAGNSSDGIRLIGSTSMYNTISGNYIGTNATGTVSLGNQDYGVYIINGANNNAIGGLTATAGTALGNVISGNTQSGLGFSNAGSGNVVLGNLIGTNAVGNGDVGNAFDGVMLSFSNGQTIGGTTSTARNVISGNDRHGITLNGISTITIHGNYIGTDITGSSDLGNAQHGISDGGGSSGVTIGGTATGAGNVISGNDQDGLALASNYTVLGNIIGLNAAGTAAIANGRYGISLSGSGNAIGGTAAGARNVISGNSSHGILITGNSNTLIGNYIGTNAAGSVAIGNATGVYISDASSNTIGGVTASSRNIISGNVQNGIRIAGSTATNNLIQGNSIGTNVAGTAAIANGGGGILISNLSYSNTIGGTATGAGNLISGNTGIGVSLYDSHSNSLFGNYIGVDTTGSVALANSSYGVAVVGALNTIGGSANGAGNTISGNGSDGIYVGGAGAYVGANGSPSGLVSWWKADSNNAASTLALDVTGSNDGTLNNGATYTTGKTGTAFSLDGVNDYVGVPDSASLRPSVLTLSAWVNPTSTTGVNGIILKGANGSSPLGVNGNSYGIYLVNGKLSYIVSAGSVNAYYYEGLGPTVPTSQWSHVAMTYDGSTMRLYLNGSEVHSMAASGAIIYDTAPVTFGSDTTAGNSATSLFHGKIDDPALFNRALTAQEISNIYTAGATSLSGNGGNVIQGNRIGIAASTSGAIGNSGNGISIASSGNIIGGTAAEMANIIANNSGDGISISSTEVTPTNINNSILGNSIYGNGSTNLTLGIDIGTNGVLANDAGDTDRGVNLGQNYPSLIGVNYSGGNATITYSLDAPAGNYRVEFFGNSSADASGYGEGQTYLGSAILTSTGSTTTGTVTLTGVSIGSQIAATATEDFGGGLYGNTSEFSLTSATSATISGRVFDDVNYGGGAGRDYATANSSAIASGFATGAIGRSGAVVELYDSSGNFLTSTTTDSNGTYTFTVGQNANYSVRVVNSTVTSVRGGSGLLPVQTFQTNVSGTSVTAVTNYVGGDTPHEVDAAANSGSQTLSFLDTQSGIDIQSVSTVETISGNVTNVDFGFNFDTIVNTNNVGQGSLRQFILNSNALGNTNLAQVGQTAGKEVSIFMISDGQAHSGLRSGILNQLTGSIGTDARAIINLTTSLQRFLLPTL
jgi:hypothetical protein